MMQISIFRQIRGNEKLLLRLFRKRIRDMKIRTKILIFLYLTVTVTCMVIGMWCYKDAKVALTENSEKLAINLMKQVGVNLDERIGAFEDATYYILQQPELRKVASYTKKEARENRIESGNELSKQIIMQDYLYNYSDYGFLYSEMGDITEFYHNGVTKLTKEEESELIGNVKGEVSITKPSRWVIYEDKLIFVRLITDGTGSREGILCFCMNDDFFQFVGTDTEYLQNNNIVVLNNRGEILRNKIHGVSEKQIFEIADYHERDYYVYSKIEKIEKDEYLVIALNTVSSNWSVMCFISCSILFSRIDSIFTTVLIVVGLVLILSLLLTTVISRTITKNIKVIESGMQKYEAGNFTEKIKPVSYDEIGLLALQFNYMGMKISELIQKVEKEENEKREAKYQTLQAQINPHFLYNILGSLKWASFRKKEYETAEVIDSLISLLRFTIKRSDKVVSLKEELDYIRNYIAIEKMRNGNAFKVKYEIAQEALEWKIPGFVLQPFVENSLLHGIDMCKNDAVIIIRAFSKENEDIIQIEDNGVGMSEEKIQELLSFEEDMQKYEGFSSVGIRIVNARLHAYYNDKYKIDIKSEINVGTVVTIYMKETGKYEMESSDC